MSLELDEHKYQFERKFSNFEEEYSNRQKDLIASYIDEDEYDE